MHNRQHGFTLVEIVAVMALGAMLLMGLAGLIDTALEDSKGQQAAYYQAQVTSAAAKYIEDKYDILGAQTAAGPQAVSLDALKAGYLPSPFPNTNVYGQTPCVLVKRRSAASGEKLDALVVTGGGSKIEDKDLAMVAANAGLGGGYIKHASLTKSMAQGASWSLDPDGLNAFAAGGCLAGDASDAGHLASALFYEGIGQLSTDFLYRNKVSGRPELNTMKTPLLMAGDAVVSEGDACAGAAIAVNKDNDLLTCSAADKKWRPISSWKSARANYDDLPATDNIGDVRMILDKNRAFTFNGSTWVALAVDQKGNLAVENDIKAGKNVSAAVDVVAGRDLVAKEGNIWALASSRVKKLYASGTGEYGTIYVDGADTNWVSADWIDANSVAFWDPHAPGEKCNIPTNPPEYDPKTGQLARINPIGSFVVDKNLVLLVCWSDATFRYQNGTYTPN